MADNANQKIELSLAAKIDEVELQDSAHRLQKLVEIYDELAEQSERLGEVNTDWAKKDKENIDKIIDGLKEEYKLNDQIIKQIKEFKKVEDKTTEETWKDFKSSIGSSFLQSKGGIWNMKTAQDFGNAIGKGLAKISKEFIKSLTNLFTASLGEMNNMLKSSFLTNATTRENAFAYGMSASQSYGFEKAKQMLRIGSNEELMYMNDTQSKKFREVMIKYSEKYNELYDKGYFDTMLEFEIQKEEFKLDFELELIKMFLDNKDIIMDAMKAVMEIAKWVAGIASHLHVASASDTISNYTNNKSIKLDTTFNISGDVNREQMINVGQQTQSLWEEYINQL